MVNRKGLVLKNISRYGAYFLFGLFGLCLVGLLLFRRGGVWYCFATACRSVEASDGPGHAGVSVQAL